MSPASEFDRLAAQLARRWAGPVTASLAEFVAVPSVSPAFEPRWADLRALDDAVDLVDGWLAGQLPDAKRHRLALPGRTPALLVDIPAWSGGQSTEGDAGGPVLVYGHLDKQPAEAGWAHTDPFVPLVADGLLYGRGSADDGYAPYLIGAVLAELRAVGLAHPRVMLLLETSEESSSVDLPAYLDHCAELLGAPPLVICLDGFVPDHSRLWITSSLRGIVVADLEVALLAEGQHSGVAGGVVASSFRVLRRLLDRIEDAATGAVTLPELNVDVPPGQRVVLDVQAAAAPPPAAALGLLPGVQPARADVLGQLLAQSWQPSIGYVGADGLPPTAVAGSVLRPATALRLSIRIPPTADPAQAARALSAALTDRPPDGARVSFTTVAAESGWLAQLDHPFGEVVAVAGKAGYGDVAGVADRHPAGGRHDTAWCACGATIPFLGMFARRYPQATILPVGVLGPGSNPHGPDEALDLEAARRLSVALARLLIDVAGKTDGH